MLIRCPECNKEISDKAHSCPHCGYPVSEIGIHKTEKDNYNKVTLSENKKDDKIFPVIDNVVRKENSETSETDKNESENPYWLRMRWIMAVIILLFSISANFSGARLSFWLLILCAFFTAPLSEKCTKRFPDKIKVVIPICLFIFAVIVANHTAKDNKKTAETETVEETEDEVVEEEIEETQEADELIKELEERIEQTEAEIEQRETENLYVNQYQEELKIFAEGNYPYITTTDLSKYHANMSGVPFYTVITVSDVKDGRIQSTLDDGFMMSNFNTNKTYSVQEDDVLAIMGTVQDYSSYGFMGTSIDFDNCMVFASGEEARAYDLGVSDESFQEYFYASEAVADSGTDLTEEEYKSVCETLGYNDILRNPSDYKGKYCKLSGKVAQIIEGWFGSYTIYIKDSSGNQWGCTYSYDDGESHVLEGDSVTVYGECKGTATTKTVLGKQVTMPHISVEYID